MHWVAPSEKAQATNTPEKHLCRVVAAVKNLGVDGLQSDPAMRDHGEQLNSHYAITL